MKLKVLVDNNTYIDSYYYGEPAVSYYIEDEDTQLLFDVGYSDIFLRNATALGVDVENIGTIIISHGHDDHTGGLKYFFEKSLSSDVSIVAHPDAFREKIVDNLKICSPFLRDQLEEKCSLILSKDPVKVSKNLIFLGEIPVMHGFERRKPIGKQVVDKAFVDDYVLDDTALVYTSQDGLYIITGCSHSGICNIIEYAKSICKIDKVIGIIGGLHLFKTDYRIHKTIEYLKQNNIKELYPCHCTSFAVKAEINKVIPIAEVGVGLEINWR